MSDNKLKILSRTRQVTQTKQKKRTIQIKMFVVIMPLGGVINDLFISSQLFHYNQNSTQTTFFTIMLAGA